MNGEYKAFKEDNYFIKDYPWNYENEFRIIFIFKKQPADRIAVYFDKNKLRQGLSVTLAPNTSNFEEEKLVLSEKCGIKSDKIKKSELDINMNLLSRNRDILAEEYCSAYCQKNK
jgi:hypothetical protein